jgi:hypothetical protein
VAVVLNILSKFDDKGVAKAQRRLATLGSNAKGFAGSTAADLVRAGSSMQRVGKSMAEMGDRMTMRFTLPIAAGFGLATKAASDLQESVNKSAVVFGGQAGQIAAFAGSAAAALGQSKQQALEATATFGNLFSTMGIGGKASADMSVELTTLASDLASFHNIAPEEALEKLRSGLVGEAEPMRALGVLLSETAVKEKAYAAGIAATGAELTEQQKVQARYAIIMEQTKTAQGDFARTSDSLANKTRIAKAELTDAGAQLGTSLIPMATRAAGIVGGLADAFGSLGPGAQTAIVGVGGAVAALGPLQSVGGRLVSLGGDITKAVGNVRIAFGENAAAAPRYARAIAKVTKGLGGFTKDIRGNVAALGGQAKAYAVSAAKTVAHTAAVVASRAAAIAASVATKAMAAAQWLLNVALSANPIGLVVVAIAGLVAAFVVAYKKSETFRTIVNAAWGAIKTAAVAVFGFLKKYLLTWVNNVRRTLSAFKAIAKFLADRFKAIKTAAVAVFGFLTGFFRRWVGQARAPPSPASRPWSPGWSAASSRCEPASPRPSAPYCRSCAASAGGSAAPSATSGACSTRPERISSRASRTASRPPGDG